MTMSSEAILSALSFSDNPLSEESFEELDKEIEKHLSSILILKNRRNRIAPISKLPPELLCHIFDFVRKETSSGFLGALKWIRVSYVCRQWRELAIATPTLWTILPLENPLWSHEMLIRSKMASLTVDKLDNPVSAPLLENIISNHMSRIRILNVCLASTDTPRLLETFPRSAPTLQSLVLTVVPRYYLARPTQERKLLPQSLGDMPRIQKLDLTSIQIDWDSHLQSTLTMLKLSGTNVPTETQFWNALERMPLLETLDLRDCLPPVPNASFSRSKLYFKNLKYLKIFSPVAEAAHLLKGISFPQSTYISMSCHQSTASMASSASNFASITMLLASHLQSNKIIIRHLDVDVGDRRLRFNLSSSIPKPLQILPKSVLSLELSSDELSYNVDNALHDLFNSFRFSNVRNMRITDGLDQLSVAKIVETFGSLPQLRRLEGNLGQNFILSMQKTFPTSNPSGRAKPTFPKLRTLCLEGASFADLCNILPDETGDITTDGLLDCFMWRYEYGVEIHTLEIEACVRVSELDILLLEEVVVDVVWDGEEIGFTDEDEDDDEDDEDMDSDGYYGFYDDHDYDDDDYDDPLFW